MLFVAWCILAGGALLFSLADATALDWRAGIAAAGIVFGPPAVLAALVTWNARRQFRQAENDLRPIHYCVHDDGMDVASVKRSGWIPWEGFREAIETPSAFVIFLEKDQHYLLPKRCFAAADDVDGMRRLLADSIRPKA